MNPLKSLSIYLRRQQIKQNAKETLKAVEAGTAFKGTANELIEHPKKC